MCADAHALETQIGIADVVGDLAKLFACQSMYCRAIAIDERPDYPVFAIGVDRAEPVKPRASNQPEQHGLGLVVARVSNGDPNRRSRCGEVQECLIAGGAGLGLQRRAALDFDLQRMKPDADRR
mgnify:CR=1 FL=1